MRAAASIVERSVVAAMALAAAAGAAVLALHHPIAPLPITAAATLWLLLTARYPQAWLFAVPALLPIADLSPWTGWIAFDEFDILVLATLAAGHARRAWRGERTRPVTWLAMAAGLALFCAPGLCIALRDAGTQINGFDGYADPVNTLRVVKSTVYALALLPLIEAAVRDDRARAGRSLALGILAGLALVTAIVVWERAAYPGLFDTTEPYRTTAAFWEMHVGGAAIDGYLALATPFVAWALWSARGKRQWAAAALLALAVGYACLTTFSRGVYAAVLLPLLVLGMWLWARHWLSRLRWRTLATVGLIALIAAETGAVLAPDSYMMRRMTRSQRDYTSRVAHWQQGLALRHTATDRWLGIGLGRLPARYAGAGPAGEFSGATRWVPAEGHGAVKIDGPKTRERLAGLYGLTQQVPARPRYRVSLDLRNRSAVDLYVRICQSHLLYDAECRYALVPVAGLPASSADGIAARWSHVDIALPGPPRPSGGPASHRGTVLTVAIANPGGSAEFDTIDLRDAATNQSLATNPGFQADTATWWPAAQFYFLPWHIDNLYLELLIERGILGLAAGALLLAATLYRLARLAARNAPEAPFLAAALLGATIVGAISSIQDAPRTAFLLALLIAFAWQLPTTPPLEPPAPPMP